MNVGDTFIHKGVTYTVQSIPTPGVVRGIAEPLQVANDPMAKKPKVIQIAEANITP